MDYTLPSAPGTSLALPVIDGVFFADNSTLTNFVECNRKGEYRIIHRREFNSTAWALEYGRRMHKALELRYTGSNVLLGSAGVTDQMQQLLADEWANKGAEPDGEWRTLDNACATVAKYNKEYPTETFNVLTTHDDTIACELAFALPLTTFELTTPITTVDLVTKEFKVVTRLPVFYTGRIDLITREADGTILVTDHKTSSVGGAGLFDEYFTGGQMKGYVWAGRQLTGENVLGARINVIGCRPPTKTIACNTFFERQIVYFDDSHIEEWKQNTILLIGDMLHDLQRGNFPMRTTACKHRFGRCTYYNVCQLPLENREMVLYSGEYRDVTWDPTADEQTLEKKPVVTSPNIPRDALDSIRSFIDG